MKILVVDSSGEDPKHDTIQIEDNDGRRIVIRRWHIGNLIDMLKKFRRRGVQMLTDQGQQ
jgi:hypothetical protein